VGEKYEIVASKNIRMGLMPNNLNLKDMFITLGDKKLTVSVYLGD